MVTIYDLLDIDEDATKEEIEEAYKKLALEYHQSPKNTDKENQENELIMNKVKMSYDILIDDEKRKRYDENIAKKRAEELIKSVEVKNNVPAQEAPANNINTEVNTNDSNVQNTTVAVNNTVSNQVKINSNVKQQVVVEDNNDFSSDEEEIEYSAELTKEEQKKLKKAAQKEFQANLKKAQKAEEEYNEAYNQAYRSYLRKNGYEVEEPWTVKRVIRVLIAIIIVFAVLYILWLIPPINKALVSIYENNVIVKSTVDIFIMFIDAIFGIFK